jgi:hypothetical protein
LGRTSGQSKVAVAVWIDPVVGSVASAIIVADPVPYAVTTPPGAAGLAVLQFGVVIGQGTLFVLTGKEFGNDDIHVTELVRSRTFGDVENVPMAIKFPVSCRLPTVRSFGIMLNDKSGSGAVVAFTVTDELAEATLPSEFLHSAVMTVFPGLTPVTVPLLSTLAIVAMLELHVICGELVTSSPSPLPAVPMAINWAFCDSARVSEVGVTVNAVIRLPGAAPPPVPVTVIVAVAETVPPNP